MSSETFCADGMANQSQTFHPFKSLPTEIMAIVAENIVLQTDAIRLGALVPVPESDMGVWD